MIETAASFAVKQERPVEQEIEKTKVNPEVEKAKFEKAKEIYLSLPRDKDAFLSASIDF